MSVVMDVDALSAAGALKTNALAEKLVVNDVNHVNTAAMDQVVHHEQQKPANWVAVRDEYLGKPPLRLKVITIGAGFSGRLEIRPCKFMTTYHTERSDRFDNGEQDSTDT